MKSVQDRTCTETYCLKKTELFHTTLRQLIVKNDIYLVRSFGKFSPSVLTDGIEIREINPFDEIDKPEQQQLSLHYFINDLVFPHDKGSWDATSNIKVYNSL